MIWESRVGDEPIKSQGKVPLTWRIAAFTAAVIALSWFFEGTRQVREGWTLNHIAVLVGGTVSTLLMLAVQAYWIYFEEKAKGTLKKRIQLFEKIAQLYDTAFGGNKGHRE